MRTKLLIVAVVVLSPWTPTVAAGVALCPTPEVTAAVRAKAGEKGDIGAPALAKELGVSEATVILALPEALRTPVAASRFPEIWAELTGWSDAVVVAWKRSNVLEIRGPIRPGMPSERSNYFNLEPGGPGLSGHLRPDLYGVIVAVSREVRGRVQNGVLFYDIEGAEVFGVYVPGEGQAVDPEVLGQYQATRRLMAGWGEPCGRD